MLDNVSTMFCVCWDVSYKPRARAPLRHSSFWEAKMFLPRSHTSLNVHTACAQYEMRWNQSSWWRPLCILTRSVTLCPANTRRLPNVGLMLVHCRRRCANIDPTLADVLFLLGTHMPNQDPSTSLTKWHQCWFNVGPPSPTLAHH